MFNLCHTIFQNVVYCNSSGSSAVAKSTQHLDLATNTCAQTSLAGFSLVSGYSYNTSSAASSSGPSSTLQSTQVGDPTRPIYYPNQSYYQNYTQTVHPGYYSSYVAPQQTGTTLHHRATDSHPTALGTSSIDLQSSSPPPTRKSRSHKKTKKHKKHKKRSKRHYSTDSERSVSESPVRRHKHQTHSHKRHHSSDSSSLSDRDRSTKGPALKKAASCLNLSNTHQKSPTTLSSNLLISHRTFNSENQLRRSNSSVQVSDHENLESDQDLPRSSSSVNIHPSEPGCLNFDAKDKHEDSDIDLIGCNSDDEFDFDVSPSQRARYEKRFDLIYDTVDDLVKPSPPAPSNPSKARKEKIPVGVKVTSLPPTGFIVGKFRQYRENMVQKQKTVPVQLSEDKVKEGAEVAIMDKSNSKMGLQKRPFKPSWLYNVHDTNWPYKTFFDEDTKRILPHGHEVQNNFHLDKKEVHHLQASAACTLNATSYVDNMLSSIQFLIENSVEHPDNLALNAPLITDMINGLAWCNEYVAGQAVYQHAGLTHLMRSQILDRSRALYESEKLELISQPYNSLALFNGGIPSILARVKERREQELLEKTHQQASNPQKSHKFNPGQRQNNNRNNNNKPHFKKDNRARSKGFNPAQYQSSRGWTKAVANVQQRNYNSGFKPQNYQHHNGGQFDGNYGNNSFRTHGFQSHKGRYSKYQPKSSNKSRFQGSRN